MKKVIFCVVILAGLQSAKSQTNADLVEMKKVGLSDELIESKISAEKANYDLSTSGILELKKAGISDRTIQAALERQSNLAATDDPAVLFSIQNAGDKLILNGTKTIAKNSEVQIYLPAGGKDFLFIKPKTAGFNAKMLSKVAGAAGDMAGAVGLGSGNIRTTMGAFKVAQKAAAVSYGADALSKIQDLPISSQAKKIAGKKMTINGWTMTDDGYVVEGTIDNKKYEINLQEAIMAGEVKI